MESQFNVYSVYDIKALRYGPMFEAVNDEIAARQYVNMLKHVQPLFRPEYKLFFLGIFDFISGDLRQDERPREVPVIYDVTNINYKPEEKDYE